jgi:hypothetical protein
MPDMEGTYQGKACHERPRASLDSHPHSPRNSEKQKLLSSSVGNIADNEQPFSGKVTIVPNIGAVYLK